MLPSWLGSIAASRESDRHLFVSNRVSAVESPLTYLSNQAVVYQATASAPRSVSGKPSFGMKLNS